MTFIKSGTKKSDTEIKQLITDIKKKSPSINMEDFKWIASELINQVQCISFGELFKILFFIVTILVCIIFLFILSLMYSQS